MGAVRVRTAPNKRSRRPSKTPTEGKGGRDASEGRGVSELATHVTLKQLLDNLGPSVAEVIVAPKGLDIEVGDPVIDDPVESPSIDPGAIVLAVGTPPDGREARALVANAAASNAAVVVFKLHGRPSDCIDDAEREGITLLALADEVGWSHLYSLLALAMPTLGRDAAPSGLGSVPVGDLFSLANAIAAMVGGAVAIEDPSGRVLAYSNLEGQVIDEPRRQGILGRQIPVTPGVKAAYQRLWASDDLIRVDDISDLEILPRLAVPVRVGRETLGSIWVIEGKTALGGDAERALAEAARIAALHMIHSRVSRDIDRRVRGDLLRSLVEGRTPAESAAARLGIDANADLVVLAFEMGAADEAEEQINRERLVDLVALYCEAFRLRAPCVALGRTVYALLPVDDQVKRERLMERAKDILEQAESTMSVPLRAAISSTVTGLKDVPGACREADRILRALSTAPARSKVASIADVWNRVILLELRDLADDHPDLTRGRVTEVIAHDTSKGTSYFETLRSYLDAFGDVVVAAENTGVHANTFRYRLRRLQEIFDLDLTDPDERLVVTLQLRLLEDAGSKNTVSQ
jgi:sugar diacid utilization regulator